MDSDILRELRMINRELRWISVFLIVIMGMLAAIGWLADHPGQHLPFG
jgi:hypothetical protein